MPGTVTLALVRPVLDVATRAGLRPRRPRAARLPIEHAFDLWADAARATDAAVPVEVARRLRLEDLGLMGLAIMTAPTGHDALATALRFAPLINDSGRWSSEVEGDRVTVRWTRDGERSLGHRIANEAGLGEFVGCMRQLLGGRFAPSRVRFRHAAPASIAAHRAFFRCPVEFDADDDAFAFDRRALDVVPAAANPALAAFVRGHAEAELGALAGSITARTRAAIDRALDAGARPEADAVALACGVSERTLRRQLDADGTRFSRLVDDALRARALTLVTAGTRPLTEVALELGFADASGFSHAFRRWYRCSPRALRSGAARHPRPSRRTASRAR